MDTVQPLNAETAGKPLPQRAYRAASYAQASDAPKPAAPPARLLFDLPAEPPAPLHVADERPTARLSAAGYARMLGLPVASGEELTDAQLAKRCPDKRCVRVATRADLAAILDDCAANPGCTPVYVHIDDEDATLLLPRERWARSADPRVPCNG